MDDDVLYDITNEDYVKNDCALDEIASERLEEDILYRVRKSQLKALILPSNSITVAALNVMDLEAQFFKVIYTLKFNEKDGKIIPVVRFSETNDLPDSMKAKDVRGMYEFHDLDEKSIAKAFTTALLIDRSIYSHEYIIKNIIDPAKIEYKKNHKDKIVLLDSSEEEEKRVFIFSKDRKLMEEAGIYSMVIGTTGDNNLYNRNKRVMILKNITNSIINTDKYKDKTYKFAVVDGDTIEICGKLKVESLTNIEQHEYVLHSLGLSEAEDIDYIKRLINNTKQDDKDMLLSDLFDERTVVRVKKQETKSVIDDDFLANMW